MNRFSAAAIAERLLKSAIQSLTEIREKINKIELEEEILIPFFS